VRVVLDTNVVLSGVFFGGVPGEILSAWNRGHFDVVVSSQVLDEYERSGAALAEGKPSLQQAWAPVMRWIVENALIVDAEDLGQSVSADPDDDAFLACALAGGARVIVSGDRHLKAVSGRRGILVLPPRRFHDDFLRT
jgi:putative PIN family toxin of toxin-antitoxin system